MSQIPRSTLVAIAAGITGGAWSAGMIACFSLIGVPAALRVPDSAVVWNGLYDHGKALMPKVGAGVAICYLYAAYNLRRRMNITGLVTAAVSAVAIAPYTFIFMAPTNDQLLAAAAGQPYESDVGSLIRKWATLNLARSLISLTSAVAGMATVYSNGLVGR